MSSPFKVQVINYLSFLGISFNAIKPKDQFISALGAFIGLLLASLISHYFLHDINPWFVAPMGASAVLLFAVPASPLAQPWSVLGGNIIASIIGIWAAQHIANVHLALGLAVGLSIFMMIGLRCLHPPSGAIAMTAVLGGVSVHQLGYSFVIFPVAINSFLMVLLAVAYNNSLGRRYPHPTSQLNNKTLSANPLPTDRIGITTEDFQRVMDSHAELLDINAVDLKELMLEAQQQVLARQTSSIYCKDIMSKQLFYLKPMDSLTTALNLFESNNLMSLPVIDDHHILVGSLSVHHLLEIFDGYVNFRNHLDGPARYVYQLMERKIFTVKPEQLISDLIPYFTTKGLHYLPVIDDEKILQGIIGRSDMIAALVELQVK